MPATDQIAKAFPHEPTPQQLELFGRLHEFLLSDNGDECFILKGYAGTCVGCSMLQEVASIYAVGFVSLQVNSFEPKP